MQPPQELLATALGAMCVFAVCTGSALVLSHALAVRRRRRKSIAPHRMHADNITSHASRSAAVLAHKSHAPPHTPSSEPSSIGSERIQMQFVPRISIGSNATPGHGPATGHAPAARQRGVEYGAPFSPAAKLVASEPRTPRCRASYDASVSAHAGRVREGGRASHHTRHHEEALHRTIVCDHSQSDHRKRQLGSAHPAHPHRPTDRHQRMAGSSVQGEHENTRQGWQRGGSGHRHAHERTHHSGHVNGHERHYGQHELRAHRHTRPASHTRARTEDVGRPPNRERDAREQRALAAADASRRAKASKDHPRWQAAEADERRGRSRAILDDKACHARAVRA